MTLTTSCADQPQLSDPVLVTVEFKVDRLWTDRELLVHLLAHLSGLLRDLPGMLADNDAAAAAQRARRPVTGGSPFGGYHLAADTGLVDPA
jgi:hypothetical protein